MRVRIWNVIKSRPLLTTFLLSVLLVYSLVCSFIGWNYQTDFCVETFEHRTCHYLTVFPGVQVFRESRTHKNPLADYLDQHGFTPLKRQRNWRYVKGLHPGCAGSHGRAKYLCKTLGCYSGKSQVWVDWFRRNPETAKALWKHVFTSYAKSPESIDFIIGLFRFLRSRLENENNEAPFSVALSVRELQEVISEAKNNP